MLQIVSRDTPLTRKIEPLINLYYGRPFRELVRLFMRALAGSKNGGGRTMGAGIVQRRLASASEALLGHAFYFARDPRSVINWYELRVYSQNGEDGILLYIFSKIGVTNRTFVEFGELVKVSSAIPQIYA